MSLQPSAIERAHDRIKAAIAGVTVEDATPVEIAEAAVSAALDLLRGFTDDRTAARSLMSRAELLIAISRAKEPAPPSETATGHAVLSVAANSLRAMGFDPDKICELMVMFGVAWIDKTHGRDVAAGTLYGVADNLAAPAPSTKPTSH